MTVTVLVNFYFEIIMLILDVIDAGQRLGNQHNIVKKFDQCPFQSYSVINSSSIGLSS